MGAAPIGKGDWVECLTGDRTKNYVKRHRHDGPPVVKGGLYRVREVFQGSYADGQREDGLKFRGIRAYSEDGREGGWPVSMFKPIYRPDDSLFVRLMSDVPADAPATPEEVVA